MHTHTLPGGKPQLKAPSTLPSPARSCSLLVAIQSCSPPTRGWHWSTSYQVGEGKWLGGAQSE